MDLFQLDTQFKKRPYSYKMVKNTTEYSSLKLHNADLQHFVVIRLPSSWVLKVLTRALFLALVIVSLPWLNTVIGDLIPSKLNEANFSVHDQEPINVGLLPALFRDLANEGLLKMGDRAGLIVTSVNDHENVFRSQVVTDYNVDVICYSDLERENVIPNEMYDLVLVHDMGLVSDWSIERIIKKDGIVTVQLSNGQVVTSFSRPSNYKIAYLRRFDSITKILAMRKSSIKKSSSNTNEAVPDPMPGRRRLFGLNTEVKKKALNNLEDVLLEPPRAASGKSNSYRKRTRFLPDLIGDSLESYSRRVFIDVGVPDKSSSDVTWFSKNYPTQNTKFEMYKIETVNEEPSREEVAQMGMSDWLRKNLKGNEYVVMKAEAEVVEELVRSKDIKLVDELFLECKHRGIKKSGKRSRRAYWECLALYGMLRDEGIAVHQWWG